MATTIEILKQLTQGTNAGSLTWVSKVDGANNAVVAEQQPIAPNINTEDGTYFAYVKLNNSNLVLNTFSAKIISAGQENQTATQSGGNANLILNDTGTSTVKVTSAKLDAFQGSVMLQWSGCNIHTERSLEEAGFGACRGTPVNDNAHKLVASYNYQKTDSNLGNLGQIYSYGNTPWNISTGRGCAVVNSPRGKDSLIKTLKFVAYNEGTIDWILEPDSSTPEGKELINLFNAITKRVAQPFAAFIGV
jgi:hypothetical protein